MGKRKHKTKRTPVEDRIVGYRERNRNLHAMGYSSYAEYLQSDLWKGIRSRVLLPDTKCYICDRLATQLHHTAYRKCDLEGRDLRRLIPLCHPCHERIEFRDGDGEKLNIRQARIKMNQLRTLHRKQTEDSSSPELHREFSRKLANPKS